MMRDIVLFITMIVVCQGDSVPGKDFFIVAVTIFKNMAVYLDV